MRRSSVTGLAEVTSTPTGLHGLIQNKKCLGFALFASLGGVLYGYNQVCHMMGFLILKSCVYQHYLSSRVCSAKSKLWLISNIAFQLRSVTKPIGTHIWQLI
jgi:hypothetical protein